MPPFRSMLFAPLSLLATTSLFSATAEVSGGSAPKPVLGSVIYSWDNLVVNPTGNGERRDVVEQPTATLETFECHVTTLNADAYSHPPHRHPQEEFIILKEGELDVSINGKAERVGPGSLFFFASNDLHNVHNVSARPATYLVFNLKTAATHSVPGTPAVESAAPGTLPSKVLAWDQLPVKQTEMGQHRSLFEAPTVTLTHLEGHVTTLNPGVTSHPPHRHPDEEILVIKEGSVDVTIEGSTQRVGPGSICFFASNDSHGVCAAGASPATYYAIRVVTPVTARTTGG